MDVSPGDRGQPALAARKPRALEPGGAIGVCAPAGPVMGDGLESGVDWWREQGHDVRLAPHLRARDGFLAGSDDERREDLLALLRDPDVAAIVLARGGYGVSRILAGLDLDEFARADKPIAGYSDVTSLFCWLGRAGIPAIHGPMFEREDLSAASRARLRAALCGEPLALEPIAGKSLLPGAGAVEGRLVGGNFTVVAATLGTPWEIDTSGAILLIEDIALQPYSLDRLLVQLRAAGKLAGLKGVAVGQLVNCESERYPETSACDVLEREFGGSEIPVVTGLPVGHTADNRALGLGVRARLDGAAGTLESLEHAVRRA